MFQEADYNDHFYECAVLQACEDTIPDEELRVVMRTLTRYLAERNNPSVGDFFGRKRTIDDLLSHVNDLNEEELSHVKFTVSFQLPPCTRVIGSEGCTDFDVRFD